MSSTVASLGRLIVLEIAPERNGWAAPSSGRGPWVDEARALLAALVGAVEDRQCSSLQVRRALDRHRAADVLVGLVDLRAGEAERAQQVEAGLARLGHRDAEPRQRLLAERPGIEGEAELEDAGQRRLDLVESSSVKPLAVQRSRG